MSDTTLRAFAVELEQASTNIAPQVDAIVRKGALDIKKGMQADLKASPHFKRVARDVSFDITEASNAVEAEIGPVIGRGKGHAGSLAFLAYVGGANQGATVRDPRAVLDEEAPRFEKYLDDLMKGVL